jgi:hypothetical protein
MAAKRPPNAKPKGDGKRKQLPKRHRKTEWNIMVYIAGDSMLTASMVSQLKEITDAGFEQHTRVLVYFDPNCNGRDARIFDVNHRRKKANPKKPTIIGDGRDPYVRNIAEDCHVVGLPQMPAAVSLRYFLEYSRYSYPAKNYMLFLLGHGVIVGNDAFLPDDDDGSAISLAQLGWILKRFSKKVRDDKSEFHLVGFHSCSMSSVELAYELAGSARYMVGTQGAAFPDSWPYRQLLKKIFNRIDRYWEDGKLISNRDELVHEILEGVQNLSFYNSEDFWLAGYSADLSLCNLSDNAVSRLTEPLAKLGRLMIAGLKDPSTGDNISELIRLAHLESQSFWGENYSDVYDFCERLRDGCNERGSFKELADACDIVVKVLHVIRVEDIIKDPSPFDQLVVYSDYYGPLYQFSHGLSIFFPWARPSDKVLRIYKHYKFTKTVKTWFEFLREYFYRTQRLMAGAKKLLPLRDLEPVPGPPDKPPSVGRISDRKLLLLGPPDKAPVMGPPDKPPTMGPPDKAPTVGPGPPDKPPSIGLSSVAVVKNFPNPEPKIVTSRPWSFDHDPAQRQARKRNKSRK